MIKNKIFHIIIVCCIAIGLGSTLTYFSLGGAGFIPLVIGQWVAFPQAGTLNADPYSKAKLMREPFLALGAAEGVMFFAHYDEKGVPLSGLCDYEIVGKNPSARLWTMFIVNTDYTSLQLDDINWPTFLNARSIIYHNATDFRISVASKARTDNWIAVSREKNFIVVMTLYDTAIVTNKGMIETLMPTLKKLNCDG
jgi:hypothetical protein